MILKQKIEKLVVNKKKQEKISKNNIFETKQKETEKLQKWKKRQQKNQQNSH